MTMTDREAMLDRAVARHDRLEDLLERMGDALGRGELGHVHEDALALLGLLEGE